MKPTEFDQLVTRLLGDTSPRVWSLLVTIFGDLALAPNARLSGGCLNALTGAIGIKPEATRVALHRLRKDGWIESQRTGRQSHYRLTALGRAETQAARPRVYATQPPETQPILVLHDPSSPLATEVRDRSDHTIRITPNCVMTTRSQPVAGDWQLPVAATDTVPQWVSDKLCPPEIQMISQELATRLSEMALASPPKAMTLLQSTALRVVTVHEWRRLILRVPHFPDTLFSDRWHGPICRVLLANLLADLPAPDLVDLERQVG